MAVAYATDGRDLLRPFNSSGQLKCLGMLALLHAELSTEELLLELRNTGTDFAELFSPFVDGELSLIALLVVVEVGRELVNPASLPDFVLEVGFLFEGEGASHSGELGVDIWTSLNVGVFVGDQSGVRVTEGGSSRSSFAVGGTPVSHDERIHWLWMIRIAENRSVCRLVACGRDRVVCWGLSVRRQWLRRLTAARLVDVVAMRQPKRNQCKQLKNQSKRTSAKPHGREQPSEVHVKEGASE